MLPVMFVDISPTTLLQMYEDLGTVRAVSEVTGLTQSQVYTRVSTHPNYVRNTRCPIAPETLAYSVQRYIDGTTIADLARELDLPVSTMFYWLRRHRKFPPARSRTNPVPSEKTAALAETCRRRRKAGETYQSIADALGYSRQYVYYLLKHYAPPVSPSTSP